jgi:hypothetical protein
MSAKRCEACGMPMTHQSQHGNGSADYPYCIYCTDPSGNLKPRSEIREGMIHYVMKSENCQRQQAEAEVDRQLNDLPAWQMTR